MTKRKKGTSPHYKANDEGGFGNPPVSGQFNGRPGPGRPKGHTSLKGAVQKLLKETITMKIDGTPTDISFMDALARRAGKEMLTGSVRGLEIGLSLAEKYGNTDEGIAELGVTYRDFSHDEKYLMRALLTRAAAAAAGGPVSASPNSNDARLCGSYRIFLRDDGFVGIERLQDQPLALPPPSSD